MDIRSLEPRALWNNFADLNAVPRASKREERVIAFVKAFGEKHGLQVLSDKAGNVVIKKPGTAGMENRATVILQAHLDMVHQKNAGTDFDFDSQGIDMLVDGDWVKARHTTLGADNGIGVAAIMALLEAADVPHPPLEALFTIDEETGMTGATELDPSMLSGKILLNLDTEDDAELCIGCAGGIDTTSSYHYQAEPVPSDALAFRVLLSGLNGGHSGMDIHKGRANANKLMNRLFCLLMDRLSISLSSLDGGSLRNAIPRESVAVLVINRSESETFRSFVEDYLKVIKAEFASIEPRLSIECEECELPPAIMPDRDFRAMVNALMAMPNGVYRMSPEIADLVEASSNLARVIVKDGVFTTQSLQRSSVESTKTEVAMAVAAGLRAIGCEIEQSGDYPGWKPDLSSPVLHVMKEIYENTFAHVPEVNACHAGLECGILGGKMPGLDMISFGPTITGAHSPEERVQVSSVAKFWKFLTEVLKNTPKR